MVDDDAGLRGATCYVLTMHGYDVVEARHGEEALQRLCAERPDLVVLDLNMPVMDGWQFRFAQRRLSDERLAATPVLLLTGADDAADQAASLAAVGLVKKPFDLEQLLDAVETALH